MTISSKHPNPTEKDIFFEKAALELLIENIKKGEELELPIISTFSMEPVILPDSKVTVRHAQVQDINLGDIVVFNHQTNLIAHRCVHVAKDLLITKGDNLSARDQIKIKPPILIGKIVSIKHKKDYWNLDSAEWKRKNLQIAKISLWQSKISDLCLQIKSKKIRLISLLGWALSRSFFYFYKLILFTLIKYVPSKKS